MEAVCQPPRASPAYCRRSQARRALSQSVDGRPSLPRSTKAVCRPARASLAHCRRSPARREQYQSADGRPRLPRSLEAVCQPARASPFLLQPFPGRPWLVPASRCPPEPSPVVRGRARAMPPLCIEPGAESLLIPTLARRGIWLYLENGSTDPVYLGIAGKVSTVRVQRPMSERYLTSGSRDLARLTIFPSFSIGWRAPAN